MSTSSTAIGACAGSGAAAAAAAAVALLLLLLVLSSSSSSSSFPAFSAACYTNTYTYVQLVQLICSMTVCSAALVLALAS
jgi:hypothetical protein